MDTNKFQKKFVTKSKILCRNTSVSTNHNHYKTVRYKDFKSSYACLSKDLYYGCFVCIILFSRHLFHCIRGIEPRATPTPKVGACLRPNAVDDIAAGVF